MERVVMQTEYYRSINPNSRNFKRKYGTYYIFNENTVFSIMRFRVQRFTVQRLNRMLSLRSVFFKIDRSTQRLTTGRIPSFDIRFCLEPLNLER